MRLASASAALLLLVASPIAVAQNVKVTPLGSHAGELCDRDRATIFEDPTGVRILYDVGHTLTGADDARLGAIHLVLLSHAHGDHLGDRKLKAIGAGTCGAPETDPAGPHSMTAEVAAAKKAAIVMTSDMGTFVGAKIAGIRGGKVVTPCPQTANVTESPGGGVVQVQYAPRRHVHRAGRGRDAGGGSDHRVRVSRQQRAVVAAFRGAPRDARR